MVRAVPWLSREGYRKSRLNRGFFGANKISFSDGALGGGSVEFTYIRCSLQVCESSDVFRDN